MQKSHLMKLTNICKLDTQTTLPLGKAARERLVRRSFSEGGSPSYAKKLRRAYATQHKGKVGRVLVCFYDR
jgi:hypothetical protein